MQIVIDIDDDTYRYMQSRCQYQNKGDKGLSKFEEVGVAIKNGTPLPKGHGRLGDLDFVAKRIKTKPPIGEIGKVTLEECYQEILQADTIIEADGGDNK